MQLKTLRLFCDAVAHGSFSKAAALNDVSPSLVSQAVTSLENRVGTQLVDRSKRPLEPTRAGHAYSLGCRELLDGLEAVEDNLKRLGDKVSGQVRVASIYSVGLLEMGQYLQRFRDQHPDVQVRMEYLHPDKVYERIRNDEADIGLVSFPREGGEFRSRQWQDQDIVLIVPPDHPLADRQSVGARQIDGRDFVSFTRELKFRRKLDRWLKSAGLSVKTVHEFDNVENIKRSVEIGSGVALVPLQTVCREVQSGSLVALTVRGVDWKRPLGIVQKRNRKLTIATTRFVELLMEKPAPQRSSKKRDGSKNQTRLLAE